MKLIPVTAERATRQSALDLAKTLLDKYEAVTIIRKPVVIDGKSLSPYFVVEAK